MGRVFTMGILALLVFTGEANLLYAQTLTNIPNNVPNTRFGSQDVFANEIVRPALSVRGFNSSTLPGGTSYGLGMKQILEKLLSSKGALLP